MEKPDEKDDGETIEVDVDLLRRTDLAIQVYDGDRTVWIPKSQIAEPGREDLDNMEFGILFMIRIPEWLAIEKELV